MLTLPGSPALSAFRIASLLARLQLLEPAVAAMQAQFLHFVDCSRELERPERALLERLLQMDGAHPALIARPPAAAQSRLLRLVVPRPGTISPWSSKAT